MVPWQDCEYSVETMGRIHQRTEWQDDAVLPFHSLYAVNAV